MKATFCFDGWYKDIHTCEEVVLHIEDELGDEIVTMGMSSNKYGWWGIFYVTMGQPYSSGHRMDNDNALIQAMVHHGATQTNMPESCEPGKTRKKILLKGDDLV